RYKPWREASSWPGKQGDPRDRTHERRSARSLSPQDVEDFFELRAELADDLLALGGVVPGLLAGQPLAGAADGEALLVQQAADLPDEDDVVALVVAAVSAALQRLELRKLLLPVAQDVRLDGTQVADFTDGEVALAWNCRKLAVIGRFQHTPLPGP